MQEDYLKLTVKQLQDKLSDLRWKFSHGKHGPSYTEILIEKMRKIKEELKKRDVKID